MAAAGCCPNTARLCCFPIIWFNISWFAEKSNLCWATSRVYLIHFQRGRGRWCRHTWCILHVSEKGSSLRVDFGLNAKRTRRSRGLGISGLSSSSFFFCGAAVRVHKQENCVLRFAPRSQLLQALIQMAYVRLFLSPQSPNEDPPVSAVCLPRSIPAP